MTEIGIAYRNPSGPPRHVYKKKVIGKSAIGPNNKQDKKASISLPNNLRSPSSSFSRRSFSLSCLVVFIVRNCMYPCGKKLEP